MGKGINKVADSKICPVCKSLFYRADGLYIRQWNKQKRCSKKCAATKHSYDKSLALKEYVDGVTIVDIAEKHGVPAHAIRADIRRINLRKRPDIDEHEIKARIMDGVLINYESGCWEWQNLMNDGGYGVITNLGRQMLAHRVSYSMFAGEIGDGMAICHSCDNRSCVNPAHLFQGDSKDNMRDAKIKGRIASGEHLPQAKLSDKDVSFIKRQRGLGVHQKHLAKTLGVSASCISSIDVGRNWNHIGE